MHMGTIFNSDNKYQILLVVVISAFILIVSVAIGLSLIDFKPKSNGNTVALVVSEGALTVNYVDGNEIIFNDSKEHKYNLSITNTSSDMLYYSLNLLAITHDITPLVEVKNEQNEIIYSEDESDNDLKLFTLETIEPQETKRYILTIIPNKKTNYKATINIVNESDSEQTFADLLLINNNISQPKTNVGNEKATEDEGLNSTNDSKGISYYFRGNVKNNYVKVGELMFRIVRINGDSTVRLVLDDKLENPNAFNLNPIDYNNVVASANLANASVLTILNDWYDKNISKYSKSVVNGEFCIDTVFETISNGIAYSDSYERIFVRQSPTLVCESGAYSGKVGLLNIDEVIFAGAYNNEKNTDYYLYKEELTGNYLTMNGFFINTSNIISMMNVMSDGSLGDGVLTTNTSYLRPVINMSVTAKVKGSGTIDNPYVIV